MGTGGSLLAPGLAVDPERPKGLKPWIDRLFRMVVEAGLELFAAVQAKARTICPADGCDRLGEADRLADEPFQLQLVMVAETGRVGLCGRVHWLPARKINAGQDLVIEPELQRHLDRAKAAAAFRLESGAEIGPHQDPPVCPDEAQPSLDRIGQTPVAVERHGDAGQRVVLSSAGWISQQPGDVERERFDRLVSAHQRAGSDASSAS